VSLDTTKEPKKDSKIFKHRERTLHYLSKEGRRNFKGFVRPNIAYHHYHPAILLIHQENLFKNPRPNSQRVQGLRQMLVNHTLKHAYIVTDTYLIYAWWRGGGKG
jgi:hypothetical protein